MLNKNNKLSQKTNQKLKSQKESRIIGVSGNNLVIQAELEEIRKLLPKLTGTFGECLYEGMKYYGINQTQLEKLSKISRRTIYDYIHNKRRAPLAHVLALCAAMKLHSRITNHLLKKAGYVLGERNLAIDELYIFLMCECYKEGLESWNQRLIEMNYPDYIL